MKGFRKIDSSNEPGRLFDIFVPDEGPKETYVDGFHGATFSPSVSKIGLSTTVEVVQEPDRGGVEKRVVYHRLVVPTDNLLEFCMQILGEAAKNRTGIEQIFENQRLKVMRALDSVSQPPEQKG